MKNFVIWTIFLISSIHHHIVSAIVGDGISGHLKGEPLADFLNNHQSLWEAKYNEENEVRMKQLMNLKYVSEDPYMNISQTMLANVEMEIPKEFDARKKWPHCKSIGKIQDQSRCGSCWAVSAAEVMTDRLCIASNGTFQKQISALDVLSCCMDAGSSGCDGGWTSAAFRCFIRDGVVTGGTYKNKAGCKPYPFRPCSTRNSTRYVRCNTFHDYSTPPCQRKCSAFTELGRSYRESRFFGIEESLYKVKGERAIQKELMTNGPLTLSYVVYEDFYYYDGGVYKHIYGFPQGGHAVKVIGWGEAPDYRGTTVPYWLIANSWNDEWGEQGFFRIIRGINDCGIEARGAAALADVSRL
ncbi:hypothetical protein AB6A40_000584 [Gnathostoma spinigerum]|uniref:Peptidase C1A papain C-terminal domain-containing protein n=1 Tax=Gnathostoma spinigerum TaxID=75299 RepID=A0ABD6EC56_9BILA